MVATPAAKQRFSGVTALVMLAALYGTMGVFARYLGDGLGLFEQWYLRLGSGVLISWLLFYRQLDLRKFLHLPRREWVIILARSTLTYAAAIPLFTVANQLAKIGPVSFMQAVPTMAIFGVLIFGEKLTPKKAALILLSFIGVVVVAVPNLQEILNFNVGELISLLSGALFSLSILARRWHSPILNNYEIAFVTVAAGAVINYALALLSSHRAIIPAGHWSASFAGVLLIAAFLSALMNYLLNYGMEQVKPILAGNIFSLEEVFGPISGLIAYKELLTLRELVGGAIILISVLLMNQLQRQTYKAPRTAPLV